MSDQEIRNSISLMIMPELYALIKQISEDQNFITCVALSDQAKREQKPMELVLRILAYHHFPYQGKIDVNNYLDVALQELMKAPIGELRNSQTKLIQAFRLLNKCLREKAFKKFSNGEFSGAFSIAAYEAVTFGVFRNIDVWLSVTGDEMCQKLNDKVENLWSEEIFAVNSGAGVRGTTRIANLLPFAEMYFVP